MGPGPLPFPTSSRDPANGNNGPAQPIPTDYQQQRENLEARANLLWGSTPRPSTYRSGEGTGRSQRDRAAMGQDGAVATSGGIASRSALNPQDYLHTRDGISMDGDSIVASSGGVATPSVSRYLLAPSTARVPTVNPGVYVASHPEQRWKRAAGEPHSPRVAKSPHSARTYGRRDHVGNAFYDSRVPQTSIDTRVPVTPSGTPPFAGAWAWNDPF